MTYSDSSRLALNHQPTNLMHFPYNVYSGDIYQGVDGSMPVNQYYANSGMHYNGTVGTQFFSSGPSTPSATVGQLFPVYTPGPNIELPSSNLQRQRLIYDNPADALLRWPPTHFPSHINEFDQQFITTTTCYNQRKRFFQSSAQQYGQQQTGHQRFQNEQLASNEAVNKSHLNSKSLHQTGVFNTTRGNYDFTCKNVGVSKYTFNGEEKMLETANGLLNSVQKFSRIKKRTSRRKKRHLISNLKPKSLYFKQRMKEGNSFQVQKIDDMMLHKCHSEPILFPKHIKGQKCHYGERNLAVVNGQSGGKRSMTGGARNWSELVISNDVLHSGSPKLCSPIRKSRTMKKSKSYINRQVCHSLITSSRCKKLMNNVSVQETSKIGDVRKQLSSHFGKKWEKSVVAVGMMEKHLQTSNDTFHLGDNKEASVVEMNEVSFAGLTNYELDRLETGDGPNRDEEKKPKVCRESYKSHSAPSLQMLQTHYSEVIEEDGFSMADHINKSTSNVNSLSETPSGIYNQSHNRENVAALPASPANVVLRKTFTMEQDGKLEDEDQLCVPTQKRMVVNKSKLRSKVKNSKSCNLGIKALSSLSVFSTESFDDEKKLFHSIKQGGEKRLVEDSPKELLEKESRKALRTVNEYGKDIITQRRSICDFFRVCARNMSLISWSKVKAD